ncbi:hypothetical protein Q1695_000352 [Nippostrongylus brasiliensis]|nr:hypothetical protein Q1695_000352 [Nippostrongylus brasiliensis]
MPDFDTFSQMQNRDRNESTDHHDFTFVTATSVELVFYIELKKSTGMRYTASYAPAVYGRKARKVSIRPRGQGSSRLRTRRDDQGRAERAEKVSDIPRLIDEEDIPQTPVVTTAIVAPSVDAKNSPLFKQFSGRVSQLAKKSELAQAAAVNLPTLPGKTNAIPGRRTFRKEPPPSPKALTTRGPTSSMQKQALDVKCDAQESTNVHSEEKDSAGKLQSTVDASALKSSVTSVLQKSGAPSPASFPKNSPEAGESSGTSTSRAKGTKIVTDLPPIEPRNAGATPSAPKALRKAYGSKSGTTICAIGSPLTATSINNFNVEDQRTIEKKVTLRKRKEQVKENAPVQIPSKCMDIGEKSSQADEQKAKKTVNAVAAAFSTQSVSVENPENAKVEEKKDVVKEVVQQPPATRNVTSATANLLAQLQLPPTVSAKVDKIIASGQKSRLQKLNDQRARMKAHLDRQQAGVLPDDDDGHLIFKKNDTLHGRWELREELGEGTFGRVVKAYDKQRDKMRAVKIVRNVHKYRDAAYLEIKVLTKLKQLDPNGTHKIIQLVEHFDYHGHCCLVFKLYGLSVFDFQRKYNFRPYHIEDTRHIMYQICYAVKFLHDNKLTHTDLKPENVLFVCDDCYTEKVGNVTFHRPKNTNVRLIDLGSATFNNEHHSAIISTRHYRAPEVILDLGWWQPCDTWSLGCILYELHRGATLFRTHSNREHLAMMERVCGHIPLRMIRKTRTKYFHNDVLDVTGTDESFIRDTCANLVRKIEDSDPEERELFELMHAMMQFEPAARITMADALQSPFFARIPENKRIPGIHPPHPIRRPGIMDPLHRGVRGGTADTTGEDETD